MRSILHELIKLKNAVPVLLPVVNILCAVEICEQRI
jgi:hypothetical protein